MKGKNNCVLNYSAAKAVVVFIPAVFQSLVLLWGKKITPPVDLALSCCWCNVELWIEWGFFFPPFLCACVIIFLLSQCYNARSVAIVALLPDILNVIALSGEKPMIDVHSECSLWISLLAMIENVAEFCWNKLFSMVLWRFFVAMCSTCLLMIHLHLWYPRNAEWRVSHEVYSSSRG